MPNNKIAPTADAAGAGGADRLRKPGSASDTVTPLHTDGAEPQRSASLTAALKQVDLDGDGIVEDWEVKKVVAEKDAATMDATGARKTLVWVLMILAASVAANAVTMMLVVDQAKDTTTKGGYLTDRAGTALRTNTSKQVLGMTSALPDSAFRRLDSFEVTGPKGSLHVRVTGFARYQDENTQYGSSVVLYCSLGSVEVDGTELYYTESSDGAYTFSRIGLNLTSDAARRGRRNPHHLRARKYEEASEVVAADVSSLLGIWKPAVAFFIVDDEVLKLDVTSVEVTETTTATTTTETATTTTQTTTTTKTTAEAFGPATEQPNSTAVANATAANATTTR